MVSDGKWGHFIPEGGQGVEEHLTDIDADRYVGEIGPILNLPGPGSRRPSPWPPWPA